MKKCIILFSIFLFAIFIETISGQETEKESGILPEATRMSLIEEYSSNPDFNVYPNLLKHLFTLINHDRHLLDVDERVAEIMGGNGQWAMQADLQDLKEFFQSCSDDGLTMVRAMGAVSSVCRKMDTILYLDGRDVNGAMEELNLSSGLALPIANLRLCAFIPDSASVESDEAFQCRLVSVYDKKYKHKFRKEVINANLKIGTGKKKELVDIFTGKEKSWEGYLVTGIMIYDSERIGVVKVKGIGGEKRGAMGFLQKVFFFVPDAVDGMTLDKKGNLTTMAFIDETIKNFENQKKYQVHRIGELPWEDEIPDHQKKAKKMQKEQNK